MIEVVLSEPILKRWEFIKIEKSGELILKHLKLKQTNYRISEYNFFNLGHLQLFLSFTRHQLS